MRLISIRFLLAFGFAAAALHGAPSNSQPYYPLNDKPLKPLHPGTTRQMIEDWSSTEVQPENLPDRTYRNIWVRMFPLLSQPLGDPYPETVNKDEILVNNSGGLKVYSMDDGELLANGTLLQFNFKTNTVRVNSKAYVLERLWIVPAGKGLTLVQWDKGEKQPTGKSAEVRTQLRGGIVVMPSIHTPRVIGGVYQLWSLINVVSVNDYLQSVVPSEVIGSWHMETMKAQAIAARTYGMYEVALSRNAGLDFDVDPSTWYQSYQGAKFFNRESGAWHTIERSNTSAAVKATGSEVLMFGNEIVRAVFSANSGGLTCTAGECLESSHDPPYLRVIDDHPKARTSPGGTWGTRANITPATVKERLALVGIVPPRPVKKLEHLEFGPSGRTWRLRVVLTDNSYIDLDRTQTRKIMHLFGPIRSFHYKLGAVDSGGKQSIVGWGYGHAVGMSQWGAQLYAKDGWSAHRILNNYYYNIKIKPLAFR